MATLNQMRIISDTQVTYFLRHAENGQPFSELKTAKIRQNAIGPAQKLSGFGMNLSFDLELITRIGFVTQKDTHASLRERLFKRLY